MSRSPARLALLLALLPASAFGAPPAGAARRDRLGDPLPQGAVLRLGTVRLRHDDGVCSVTFSPDGKLLASVSRDRTVRLWESATGREVRRFEEADCEFYALAFAPDGKTLAAAGADPVRGGGAAVRLFDVATGGEVRRLEGHAQPAFTLAFGPDGASLFSVSCGQAIRWEVETGRVLGRWRPAGPTASLAVARDLTTLTFAGSENEDRAVHVWDATTGRELRALKGHRRGVTSVALAADGRTLASANPFESIRLWDLATGQLIRRFHAPHGGMALAFAPDGKLLASACMKSGTVRLWDTATGQVVRSLSGYQGWVNGLAFSPDGKVLALAGADAPAVHLWEVATSKDLRPRHGHEGHVEAVAFAPDGRLLASAGGDRHDEDTAVRLWDAATGAERRRLEGHAGNVHALAFSPDGRTLASGGAKEDSVRLWDADTGSCVRRLRRAPGKDEEASPERRVSALAFSPDGKTLAAGLNEGHLVLFDAATGAERRRLAGHDARITTLAFSPDGASLASGALDRTARLWDVTTGKEVRRYGQHQDTVRAVAFTPDGRLLGVGAGDWEGVGLWEVATGREVGHVPVEEGRFHHLAFSPDGRTLAVGCAGNALRLYEVATGKERRELPGHPVSTRAVAFAPDGRRLASGGGDGTVLLWDLVTPEGEGPAGLTEADLEALWADLGGEDAARADRAVRALLAAPRDTLPFLQDHLRPAPAASRERLAALLGDLDHVRYQVRYRATSELERLGELAEPLLRRRQTETPSAEAQRRIDLLLRRLDTATLSQGNLRLLRAFEVLERLGGDGARSVLEAHAREAEGGRLGREAQASLERLARRGR